MTHTFEWRQEEAGCERGGVACPVLVLVEVQQLSVGGERPQLRGTLALRRIARLPHPLHRLEPHPARQLRLPVRVALRLQRLQ
eukprot:CAMPEP_0196750534 /NCGR_PEP_ID=MMETSP1091-20130531/80832_1 /TAXON_ID=302021 /ORGANISM="Rhodomonas sp., Strain CCMP768" /LENGTH=82 /DNA_ID=CAMNT_0042098165 /DNA_START=173 /DNA_END=418 /DNA_ORIENTATION=-